MSPANANDLEDDQAIDTPAVTFANYKPDPDALSGVVVITVTDAEAHDFGATQASAEDFKNIGL